jgi:phospholipid/cholesterol/gamma-HCH transport system permease protein
MNSGSVTYFALARNLSVTIFRRQIFGRQTWRLFISRSVLIGVRAGPTLFVMAFAIGFVIALVLQAQLAQLGMDDRVPRLMWIILNEQLAPVLTAVVFIGRSVSGSAAELASMKVSEEIKALETMGIDVSGYLLFPMFAAFAIMLPVMEVFTVAVGLFGGYTILAQSLAMTPEQFILRSIENATTGEIWHGIGKASLFSVIVAMIAFHKGLNATGGSDEVGRVATEAVVAALLAVTVVNAVVTYLTVY